MHLAMGLMSGTSMDGIDGAIIKTDGESEIELISTHSRPYPDKFRLWLRGAQFACQQTSGDVKKASKYFHKYMKIFMEGLSDEERETVGFSFTPLKFKTVVESLVTLHGYVVRELLFKADLSHTDIDVVGFHGQNLYHNPAQRRTVQVGFAGSLAIEVMMRVVHDFRLADVLKGGQGAPLAPLYHKALAVKKNLIPLAVVNCGGIANVTLIHGKEDNQMIGFDTGPGNVLIDKYVRIKTLGEKLMDEDGMYGLQGKVNEEIVQKLRERAIVGFESNFLDHKPPKSLDTGNFELIDELDQLDLADGCATLEFFSAQCIVESISLVDNVIPKNWVLCGGGWKNPVILKYFKELLHNKFGNSCKIQTADEVGWSTKYMEAEMFGYFAIRYMRNLPISFPNTTGVCSPTVGGKLFFPKYKE